MKTLILVALDSEFSLRDEPDMRVIYTGIGKINASYHALKGILDFKPELVINVGTAGSVNPQIVSGIHVVKSVIERDINAYPLAPRGVVPFDKHSSEITSDIGTVKVASGDSFVTEVDPWLMDNGVDLVDMELFAIAKVSEKMEVPWRSLKVVSDAANSDAHQDWQKSLKSASEIIRDNLKFLMK